MTGTRFPLHTERAADVLQWTDIGWTDCGEHPSEPGYHMLEWRGGGATLYPACAHSVRLGPESIFGHSPDTEIDAVARPAGDLGQDMGGAT
jgi:hypothetical protein